MTGHGVAAVAKVMANPTCAAVLDALLSERAVGVSALAHEIRTPRSTVSEAVGALVAAGLVHRQREGRRTIVWLAGHEVADAVEALGRLAQPRDPVGLRAVSRMQALRRGRTCYDHLAGEVGVRLADRLLSSGILTPGPDGAWLLPEDGRRRLVALGVDAAVIGDAGARPLVRACRDWTEKRDHVAGRLGAAICTLWLQAGLLRRLPGSRAVQMLPAGERWIAKL